MILTSRVTMLHRSTVSRILDLRVKVNMEQLADGTNNYSMGLTLDAMMITLHPQQKKETLLFMSMNQGN